MRFNRIIDQLPFSLPIGRLSLLTIAALLVHGYHLGTEDAEIYLPGALKASDPSLFSFAPQFFQSHAHLSLFSSIVGWSIDLTHLPPDWMFFLWYLATLFATLISCWLLAAACFESSRARWGAVLITTVLLTMPATNTGLLLVDPYLTARSLSTPLCLLTLAGFVRKRFAFASVALVLTALIHPQMVAYLAFLLGVIHFGGQAQVPAEEPVPVLAGLAASLVFLLPSGFHLDRAHGAYREALYSRDYFFLYNWTWYHWLGLLAPLGILAYLWKSNLRGTRPAMRSICLALIPFGLASIAAAAVFASSPSFDMFERIQPLRSFHLITLIFIMLLGGILAEYTANKHRWILPALALSLAAGMFIVAQTTYPDSPHIELPSATSSNPWINTLLWVRHNTPKDAVFAVDSDYFKAPGTDMHGFRAISERSALADYYKDSGAVSLFPELADSWKAMSSATTGLNHFQKSDFERLKQEYPRVSWTIVRGKAPAGLDCPFTQSVYTVCRLPATEGNSAALQNVSFHGSDISQSENDYLSLLN